MRLLIIVSMILETYKNMKYNVKFLNTTSTISLLFTLFILPSTYFCAKLIGIDLIVLKIRNEFQ